MSSNSPPQTPAPPNRRRSSIAELFQPRMSTSSTGSSGNPAYSANGSNSQPRQNNHPRRVSISTALGISGSPTSNQNTPFGNYHRRRDSVSSSQDTGSPNSEDAIMEDNEGSAPQNTPVSPFARRVSFGAQAFGSVRSGGGSISNGGEGFNWGDNLREKSSKPPPAPARNPSPPIPQRSASIATMEPPKQMPPPQQPYKPDHIGERMLRGDFMMD